MDDFNSCFMLKQKNEFEVASEYNGLGEVCLFMDWGNTMDWGKFVCLIALKCQAIGLSAKRPVG